MNKQVHFILEMYMRFITLSSFKADIWKCQSVYWLYLVKNKFGRCGAFPQIILGRCGVGVKLVLNLYLVGVKLVLKLNLVGAEDSPLFML